jgi:hypothetical protein
LAVLDQNSPWKLESPAAVSVNAKCSGDPDTNANA